QWETVIGLEVHCELSTDTKLFCGCRNVFGDEPNTNICPVCLGLPGSLPVIHVLAVEYAMRIGTALQCTVEPSIFHRKSYFYPDIRSAGQAHDYVVELRAVLEAIGVSDVKMEEGSLRVDSNVSMRRAGSDEFGTRCEIKNLNSLRSLVRAIEYEAHRQVELLEAGEKIVQETRHWNEEQGRTHSLRSKEEAYDYRY